MPDIYIRHFFTSSYRIHIDPTYKVRAAIARSVGAGSGLTLELSDITKEIFLPDKTSRWLVVHEFNTKDHAMVRCWKPFIDKLKSLHLVDELSAEDFLGKQPLAEYFKSLVRKKEYNVVFFPSIGMNDTIIKLAMVRTEAMQLAGTGHPGEFPGMPVDAILAYGDVQYSRECRIPKIKLDDFRVFEHSEYSNLRETLFAKERKPILAINAKAIKFSDDFLNFVENLANRLPQQVRLRIFPTESTGVHYYSAKRLIQRYLPNAEIIPYTDYPRYLDKLSECSACVAPFPFGNTNGHYDAIKCGIPSFCLEGTAVQSRGDAMILSSAGMESNIATSVEDLESKILAFFTEPRVQAKFAKAASLAYESVPWAKEKNMCIRNFSS